MREHSQQNTAGTSNFSLARLKKGPFKEIYFLGNNLYYNAAADRHVRIFLILGGEKLCQVIMIFCSFFVCVCDDISKAIIASMNQNNHKEIDNERTSDFIYTEVHKPEGTSFLIFTKWM